MRNVLAIICLIAAAVFYQSFFGGKPGSAPTQALAPAAAQSKWLTDAEAKALLDRGKAVEALLSAANKPRPPGSPIVPVTRTEYDAAYKGLLQILPDSSSYQEAQKTIASLDKQTAQGEEIARKAAAKVRAENVAGRKSFAVNYERDLLRKGLSVTVTTEGDRSSTLKVKYVLVSKALAFQLSENQAFLSQLREVGFRKLVLSDGYNEAWSLQL